MAHKTFKQCKRLPILMYHDILGDEPLLHKYTVRLIDFSNQMAYIKNQSFLTLSLKDYSEYFSARESDFKFPPKTILLTFDDGHVSNYFHALPLLLDMGFTASFFITTKYINQKKDFVTQRQIQEMSEKGMTIGSHTYSHRFLDELSSKDIYEELNRSKSCLEDIIGKEVSFLSCPGGRYSPAALDIAADTGYRAVFTSVPTGIVFDGSILVGGRFLIDSTTQFHTFKQIANLDNIYVARKRFGYELKGFLKRAIGNKAYYKIWRRIATSSKP